MLSSKLDPYEFELKNDEAILYALAIGFQQDPMNRDHYKYTYENAEGFQAFPTNALVVCHRGRYHAADFNTPGIPPFNPAQSVHGEEHITFIKPLVIGLKYKIEEKIVDLQDKGSGGLMTIDSRIYESKTCELVAIVRSSVFIRGIGGFGCKKTISSTFSKIPTRAPDFV